MRNATSPHNTRRFAANIQWMVIYLHYTEDALHICLYIKGTYESNLQSLNHTTA